jgi:predicted flap endonuclease-1-like 5' DNA nuclease
MVLGLVIDDKRREVERLMSKVAMLASQPPEVRTVEKRVEVPVERVVLKRVEVPVEKVVDRPVDNPQQLARIKALEGEVAMIAGLFTQIAQLKPFSSQAGERRREGRVLVPVDNPEQLARIKALEAEVAVIADLRAQMTELRAAVLEACEGVVEKRIVNPTEQNGEVPLDNPEKLARIKAVESEVAVIAELRARIAELLATSLQANEKVVEKRIETPIEQIVVQNADLPVETISEPAEDLDHASTSAPSDEGQAAGESPDNLKHIRGVGPALERFLHKRGVFWFRQVATWSQADIDKFEFLLPNFSGRIQRERWVQSARVEHYKKHKQWLGDGEPPSESPDLRAQIDQLQAAYSQVGANSAEQRSETVAETNGEIPIETVREQAVNLTHADDAALLDEGQAAGESPDNLKHIRGVGPALERFLHKRGVFWFRQVATWSQADIDKFEFLLPNFSGRIQRERWVQSARVEHYKKHKQWLGDGEPPSESPDLRAQIDQLQAAYSQVGANSAEQRSETVAETNGEIPIETVREQAVNLTHADDAALLDEGQAAGESPDNLKHISGVGPALERFLHKRGVFWFRQVATWSQADIDKFEFLLPNFGGRIQRENWVQNAQVEYYKKYKKRLGDDGPTGTTPDKH